MTKREGDPTWVSRPAKQIVIEKDGWRVTMVEYSAEEARETAALLLYGE